MAQPPGGARYAPDARAPVDTYESSIGGSEDAVCVGVCDGVDEGERDCVFVGVVAGVGVTDVDAVGVLDDDAPADGVAEHESGAERPVDEQPQSHGIGAMVPGEGQ